MQVHWPLVISTACQRAGLGLFVCAFIVNLLGAKLPMDVVAWISLAFLAVGGCASVAHLQRPQRFFNAFSNLKSHLTQEGLITPFLGIALLVVALVDAGAAHTVIEGITALLAFAFLLVTGLAYQMKSRPAWNTGLVLGLFLLTALSAGTMGCAALAALTGNAGAFPLAAIALAALVICVVVQFAYIARMKKVGYGVAVDLTAGNYRVFWLVWLVASIVQAVCIFALLAGIAPLGVIGWAAAFVAAAAWTALFFKGALKVRMFPMYAQDLNLDM